MITAKRYPLCKDQQTNTELRESGPLMFMMLSRNGGGLVAPEAFEVLSRLATAKSSMRDAEIIPGLVGSSTSFSSFPTPLWLRPYFHHILR